MNFLSIDLEDWHTSAYLREYVNEANYTPRIEESTLLILNSLERLNIKATFFILGSIAKKYPVLIKKIAAHGHEIASHGFSHTPLWNLNPTLFATEILETNKILEDLTGEKILGFRAPYASLRQDTSWAIDVLKEANFRYDSSIFPMRTPLYGVKNAPTSLYKISSNNICKNDPQSKLLEIPFTIYKNKFLSIPCTGGIYARFLPEFFLIYLLQKIEKKQGLNFYFHPWEIDNQIPKIDVPIYNKIVSYYKINNHLAKIERISSRFQFQTFKSALDL